MYPHLELGSFTLYIYPLLMGIAWAVSLKLSLNLAQNSKHEFPHLKIFLCILFLSVWMGAKLLFVLTLDHEIKLRALNSYRFWSGGGFVFYGGAIFGFLCTYIYTKITKISFKKMSFLIAPLVFGHSIGRLGCFMAGCCYGKSCDLFISVYMHGENRWPVALMECIALLILGGILLRRYVENKSVIVEYLISYSVIRFILEYFRGDQIRGEFFELSTSQIISLIVIFINIIAVTLSRVAARRLLADNDNV